MSSFRPWHTLILGLLIGYALGYWMPTIGNLTIGKIKARA